MNRFSNAGKKKIKDGTILFVGGLEYRKGLEYLLLALERVCEKRPETILKIVARDSLRKKDEEKFF